MKRVRATACCQHLVEVPRYLLMGAKPHVPARLTARKQWLSGHLQVRGSLRLDAGAETRRIMGKASSKIGEILGYVEEPELMHRDNLVLR